KSRNTSEGQLSEYSPRLAGIESNRYEPGPELPQHLGDPSRGLGSRDDRDLPALAIANDAAAGPGDKQSEVDEKIEVRFLPSGPGIGYFGGNELRHRPGKLFASSPRTWSAFEGTAR